MEVLNFQPWVHYWFNLAANNWYFVFFNISHSSQCKGLFGAGYTELLNEIPSDNSSLWDRNNKTHCLAVVKWDIHHVGAWQQWLAGALFWLNSKPIKCYSLTLYTECDFNNPLNQVRFLSQLLRLFLFIVFALITQWTKGHERWDKEMCVTCDMDSRPSAKWAAWRPPQIQDCNYVTSCSALHKGCLVQVLYNNGTSMLSSGLKITRNHLFIMKNVTIHCCLDGRWHCDSNLFMLWLWERRNKLGFCGLLSKSDHSRKFRWSYYRTALSSFPCR